MKKVSCVVPTLCFVTCNAAADFSKYKYLSGIYDGCLCYGRHTNNTVMEMYV